MFIWSASDDALGDSTDAMRIDYTLEMINVSEDRLSFCFPARANACFDVTMPPAEAQVLPGLNRAPKTVPIGFEALETCQSTPPHGGPVRAM